LILKNRKLITVILYIAILALAFSWMLGLFGGNKDNLPYSQIVNLFQQQQVKTFLVDGETIYIPRKAGKRLAWGCRTSYKSELRQRNALIHQEHASGVNVPELSKRYHLSEKSIRRILKNR